MCWNIIWIFYWWIFIPLERVAGAATPEGLEIPHGQQQSQVVLLDPDQDGTKQGRRCNHASWLLVDLLGHFIMGVASRTCLDNLSWDILNTRPKQRTWDLSIRRRGGSAFRTSLFRSCALCCEVSRRQFLAKSQFLPLVLEIVFFQSLPKIHDHRWGSEQTDLKTDSFAVVSKLPFCRHRAIKLTQNCVCFTNPCINLSISPSVAREYHSKVLELGHLLQCTYSSLAVYTLHRVSVEI